MSFGQIISVANGLFYLIASLGFGLLCICLSLSLCLIYCCRKLRQQPETLTNATPDPPHRTNHQTNVSPVIKRIELSTISLSPTNATTDPLTGNKAISPTDNHQTMPSSAKMAANYGSDDGVIDILSPESNFKP